MRMLLVLLLLLNLHASTLSRFAEQVAVMVRAADEYNAGRPLRDESDLVTDGRCDRARTFAGRDGGCSIGRAVVADIVAAGFGTAAQPSRRPERPRCYSQIRRAPFGRRPAPQPADQPG